MKEQENISEETRETELLSLSCFGIKFIETYHFHTSCAIRTLPLASDE